MAGIVAFSDLLTPDGLGNDAPRTLCRPAARGGFSCAAHQQTARGAFRAPRINKPHAYGIRACATARRARPAASVARTLQGFIEDTDCFQIVFYANYLRYYQRAGGPRRGPARRASSRRRADAYAKPAIMGDALRVEGALEAVEDGVSYWRARVVRATATGDDEVLNSALLGVQPAPRCRRRCRPRRARPRPRVPRPSARRRSRRPASGSRCRRSP